MSVAVKGLWNVVLSGYPKTGKTMLARRLVAEHKNFARVGVDELRQMLFKEVYPHLDLESIGVKHAKTMLVRRYIRTFGPVAEEDIAWWTSFSKTDLKKVITAIEKELLRVNIEGFELEYLMLQTDYAHSSSSNRQKRAPCSCFLTRTHTQKATK